MRLSVVDLLHRDHNDDVVLVLDLLEELLVHVLVQMVDALLQAGLRLQPLVQLVHPERVC